MEKLNFSVRRAVLARRKEKPKTVHKAWVDFPSGAKAILTDLCIVLQLALLAFLYTFFAVEFRIFFIVSIALTVGAAIHVFICEKDAQSKASWLLLFILSCGSGYIIYLLADKRVCYGYDRRRFAEIFKRSQPFVGTYTASNAASSVLNDCEYIYNSGGFIPYDGTDMKYFCDARALFDNLVARLESAKEFVFIEYFIVSDGVLMERFLDVLKRKVAQGVDVRLLYDDVGSQGVFSAECKARIRSAGIKLKVFARLFAPFSFGLNYRDHRKIVVIDGKTGYVGGCNIADECVNEYRMQGMWKDAGIRLDGAAVDGLSLAFIRQWEFATREKLDFANYLNRYDKTENTSLVVPYAGGPEIKEDLCRGVYLNVITGAREKLYIMSPYLVPDGDLFAQLISKAKSGVDVRLVLPAVPDYKFIYMVTRSNAERLMKSGVKIYYVRGKFVHSKVMLTENCVTVGSVNLDMRAFYQEFDNGVYTNDGGVMSEVAEDFESVFASESEQQPVKHNVFWTIATSVLRIVSPLM